MTPKNAVNASSRDPLVSMGNAEAAEMKSLFGPNRKGDVPQARYQLVNYLRCAILDQVVNHDRESNIAGAMIERL